MAIVCLLSSIHPWVNPRVIKEADALHAAGHDVTLVYRAVSPWADARDEALLADRRWKHQRFSYGRHESPVLWALAATRQRAAAEFVRWGAQGERLDAEAYCRGFSTIRRWAARHPADLYIAHTQQMLPVAAYAAQENGVPFAFDCEDLLAEESSDGLRAPWVRDAILRIERRYLPRARYVTATSEPMSKHLRAVHALRDVRTVHNCFPTAEFAAVGSPHLRPSSNRVRMVWLSATIGPDRGLEDIFTALSGLDSRFELHLVGDVLPAHERWLATAQASLPQHRQARVHPVMPSVEIPAFLAQFDIGLALDVATSLNRRLTITNKLFLYLQAGLAVAATNTPGHASILNGSCDPAPGILYAAGDAMQLVATLLSLSRIDVLSAARQAAWRAGRQRFNWEVEGATFLQAVEQALEPAAAIQPRAPDFSVP